MTPRQCFGLVIRTFGLFLTLCSVYFSSVAAHVAVAPPQRITSTPLTYVYYAVIGGALGLYLLRGAPALLDFCYPPSSENE